jgi:hypothetical protein
VPRRLWASSDEQAPVAGHLDDHWAATVGVLAVDRLDDR